VSVVTHRKKRLFPYTPTRLMEAHCSLWITTWINTCVRVCAM